MYYYEDLSLQYVNFSDEVMTKNSGESLLYNEFLKNVKGELKKKGLTYESFARLFKHGPSWIGLKMTGDREFSVRLLFEIAEILNINPSSLLPGGNPAPKLELEDYIIQVAKKGVREDMKNDIRLIVREEIEKALKKK